MQKEEDDFFKKSGDCKRRKKCHVLTREVGLDGLGSLSVHLIRLIQTKNGDEVNLDIKDLATTVNY